MALIIFSTIVLITVLLGLFLIFIPVWKTFTKAGRPGWESLIPLYNIYVMVEIAGLPWWCFVLLFIPFINFAVVLIVLYHFSQRFGHGMGYALGMIFLPIIFWPILGYGSSVYTPKQAEAA